MEIMGFRGWDEAEADVVAYLLKKAVMLKTICIVLVVLF